jgi:hypothetical protein
MGSVMVISQIPGASVVDCLSLCRRNAAALPRWARVVMYGQSCGGECLGVMGWVVWAEVGIVEQLPLPLRQGSCCR